MAKKLYFGTNLKMYKTIQTTADYLIELQMFAADLERRNIQLFVIPSFTALDTAARVIDQDLIKLGAQNMSWEDEGQYTGEISPVMLEEIGIRLVMIGHSERRHIMGETDIEENKKVRKALAHDFTVLLCIGETLEEKNFNIGNEVLRMQLKTGLCDVPPEYVSNIWVAYEPVWAIGVNGTPPSAKYVQEKHRSIKETLKELFGEAGADIPVLYGGSVNPENANELIVKPSIDGLFVGRSAWDAAKFASLIRESLAAYKDRQYKDI